MDKRQKRIPKSIVIWRDSVAAGDDCFAPHEEKIEAYKNKSLEQVIEEIIVHYLPKIQGGKATWIIVGKGPLAVVAQQWEKPYYLVESTTRIEDLIEFSGDHQLEFKYWCQVEPNEVIDCIKRGEPWPDMWERKK